MATYETKLTMTVILQAEGLEEANITFNKWLDLLDSSATPATIYWEDVEYNLNLFENEEEN